MDRDAWPYQHAQLQLEPNASAAIAQRRNSKHPRRYLPLARATPLHLLATSLISEIVSRYFFSKSLNCLISKHLINSLSLGVKLDSTQKPGHDDIAELHSQSVNIDTAGEPSL